MTIAFQSATNAGVTTTSATTLAVTKPTSTASGDLLVTALVCIQGQTVTTLSGWTQVGTGVNGGSGVTTHLYYRVADGTEGASFTWAFALTGGNSLVAITCLRFTGTAATSVLGVNFTATGTNVSTKTAATLTGATSTSVGIIAAGVRPDSAGDPVLSTPSTSNWVANANAKKNSVTTSTFDAAVGVSYNLTTASTAPPACTTTTACDYGIISAEFKVASAPSTNAPADVALTTAASNDATTTEVFGVGEPSSAAAGLDATVQVGLAPTAGVATSTASGLDATVTGTSNAFPDAPSATSTALDASVSTAVSVSADVATATVLANDATCTQGVSPVAETPNVTATSNDATVLVTASPTADVAPATAIGLDATVTTTAAPTAQAAPVTATANDATVSTSGSTNAPADVALVTAAGLDAAVTTSVAVLPDAPSATGLAYDATTLQAVSPSAECPTSPAVAYDATVTMSSNTSANADLTTATGLAYDATVATQVVGHAFAGVATATAAAYDAVASHPVRVNADVATSSVTALGALAHGGVIIAKLEYTWQVPFEVRDLPVGSEVRTYTLEGDWDKVPQSV